MSTRNGQYRASETMRRLLDKTIDDPTTLDDRRAWLMLALSGDFETWRKEHVISALKNNDAPVMAVERVKQSVKPTFYARGWIAWVFDILPKDDFAKTLDALYNGRDLLKDVDGAGDDDLLGDL